jgi:hypothetical protein
MYTGLRVKYPLFFSGFNQALLFSTEFSKKNTQIPNFMKIRPLAAQLFLADGRKDGQT